MRKCPICGNEKRLGARVMRAVEYEDADGVSWMVLDEHGKIIIHNTDEHTARLIAQRLSD